MKRLSFALSALVLLSSAALADSFTAAPRTAVPNIAPSSPAVPSWSPEDKATDRSPWWKFWNSDSDSSDLPAPEAPASEALPPSEPLWTLTLRNGTVRSVLPSSISFQLDVAPAPVDFSPELFSSLSVSAPSPHSVYSPTPAVPSALVAVFRAVPSCAISAPLPKTFRARAADGEKIVVPWSDVISLADPSVRHPHPNPATTLPATVTLLPSASSDAPVPDSFPIALLPIKTARFSLHVPSWLVRSLVVNPDRSVTLVSVYGDVLTGDLPLRRVPGFERAVSVSFPSAVFLTPPPSALQYRLSTADILVASPTVSDEASAAPPPSAPRRSLRAAAASAAAPSTFLPVSLVPCLDPSAPVVLSPTTVEASAAPSASLPPAVLPYAPSARASDEILVPATTFRIGTAAPNAPRDETPPATVSLDPFYLASTPVTVAQFAAFVDATSYRPFTASDLSWQNPGFPQTPNDPVVAVSWRDAAAYCNWLSKKAGFTPAYSIPSDLTKPVAFDPVADGYRLPLEAEWELAARNLGKPVSFPWGNDPAESNLVQLANFSPVSLPSPFPFTSPVKTFPPSPLGFYDLAGNVAEWCQDAYQPDAYSAFYPTQNYAPLLNPDAPCARVIRGGSYLNTRAALRTTARAYGLEIVGIPNEVPPRPRCGFRVARNAP